MCSDSSRAAVVPGGRGQVHPQGCDRGRKRALCRAQGARPPPLASLLRCRSPLRGGPASRVGLGKGSRVGSRSAPPLAQGRPEGRGRRAGFPGGGACAFPCLLRPWGGRAGPLPLSSTGLDLACLQARAATRKRRRWLGISAWAPCCIPGCVSSRMFSSWLPAQTPASGRMGGKALPGAGRAGKPSAGPGRQEAIRSPGPEQASAQPPCSAASGPP